MQTIPPLLAHVQVRVPAGRLAQSELRANPLQGVPNLPSCGGSLRESRARKPRALLSLRSFPGSMLAAACKIELAFSGVLAPLPSSAAPPFLWRSALARGSVAWVYDLLLFKRRPSFIGSGTAIVFHRGVMPYGDVGSSDLPTVRKTSFDVLNLDQADMNRHATVIQGAARRQLLPAPRSVVLCNDISTL